MVAQRRKPRVLLVARTPVGFTTMRAAVENGVPGVEVSATDAAGLEELRRQGFVIAVQRVTPMGILIDYSDRETDLRPPKR